MPDDWDAPWSIRLRITDADGTELFAGETSTDRMKRTPRELAQWAVRDNPIPPGSVLLTGTGLVPPDDYTLRPGQSRDRDRGHRHPHEPGCRLTGTVPV